MRDDRKRLMMLIADVSTIGLTIAASIFIGLGVGYVIDKYLFGGRTTPWFTVIFLIFGIVAGFQNLVRVARRKDL